MIDTDKYEGHTEAPWTLEHLEDDEGQQWFEVPAVHYTTKQSGDGSQQEYTDAQLIADAPLLLAEVKQLQVMNNILSDMAGKQLGRIKPPTELDNEELLAEVKRLNAYIESIFDGGHCDIETYEEYKERIE